MAGLGKYCMGGYGRFGVYRVKYFNVAPFPELIVRPQRPFIPKMVLLSAL